MALRITQDEIVRITQLYDKLGSYAAVAREIGRTVLAVSRYVKLKGTPKVVKDTLRML